MDKKQLKGISTVNFYASNHNEAIDWYTKFLGIEPYFKVAGYAEFRVGDYQQELGIVDSKFSPQNISDKPAGVIVYWHVDNLQETFNYLQSLGAKIFQPIINRGNGFVTASVLDPFGNILGIMTNPHYLEILEKRNGA